MDRTITLLDKTSVPYIPNEEIEAAIDRVADKLNDDFKGCAEPPILLCTLNGAIMFTAALMRRLDFPVQLMSMKLSSYRGTECTGEVRTVMNITGDVAGRDVIIVEDIVDTGNTMEKLLGMMKDAGARGVKVCTMLLKPEIFKKDFPID